MTQWLRNRLNKRALVKLRRREYALAVALMQPDPEHPLGHPHTHGLYDGIRYAIDVLEGKDYS